MPVLPELAPPGAPYPVQAPDGGYRPNGYPPSRGYPPAAPIPGGPVPGGYPSSGYPRDEYYAPRPAGPANGHGPAGYHGPSAPARPVSYPAPRPPASAPLPVPEPGTFVYRDSGGPDEPEDAEAAALDGVYGPDDPAYGPPDPSWYDRQQEEDESARRQAEELQHARGAFEPLRHADSAGQGYHAEAGYQAPGDEAPASPLMVGEDEDEDEDDRDAAHSEAALSEAALAQIKDLYMTAEAIGEENLGKHYEQLLERQRQLITEYFSESGFGDSGASQVSVSGESPR